MTAIDISMSGGVTRDPYHPTAKGTTKQADKFAINFDTLKITVDDKPIDIKTVLGAYPGIDCVLVMVKDGNGFKMKDSLQPVVESVIGKVKIEGTPQSCGCGMSKFQVRGWESRELLG